MRVPRMLRYDHGRVDADAAKKQLNETDRDLKAAENCPQQLIVSEHAMLRYFERVVGFNLDDVRRTILPDSVREQVGTLGDGVYPCGGHSVLVRGRVVVLTKE